MIYMNISIDRRALLASLASLAALAAGGCTTVSPLAPVTAEPARPPIPEDVLLAYAAMPDEQFPIPAVDLSELDPRYFRQVVDYSTQEAPGTVVVDTAERYLYHVQNDGMAMRYGVGIGSAGFEWSGRAHVAYKREWPVWTPPADMIKRQPGLEKWRSGHPPGIDNPLGARALYVHQGNRDTLYRIHGTAEVWTIGNAVSSGCVRLLHQDVIDLYDRVRPGSPMVVLA
jgi:lipoprotein-anchoring transpeptidase ErfK/SrfK